VRSPRDGDGVLSIRVTSFVDWLIVNASTIIALHCYHRKTHR